MQRPAVKPAQQVESAPVLCWTGGKENYPFSVVIRRRTALTNFDARITRLIRLRIGRFAALQVKLFRFDRLAALGCPCLFLIVAAYRYATWGNATIC
jgi:hypothetical protein